MYVYTLAIGIYTCTVYRKKVKGKNVPFSKKVYYFAFLMKKACLFCSLTLKQCYFLLFHIPQIFLINDQ